MTRLETHEFAVADTHGFQEIDNFAVRKTSDTVSFPCRKRGLTNGIFTRVAMC
jgi:hypothetical protein